MPRRNASRFLLLLLNLDMLLNLLLDLDLDLDLDLGLNLGQSQSRGNTIARMPGKSGLVEHQPLLVFQTGLVRAANNCLVTTPPRLHRPSSCARLQLSRRAESAKYTAPTIRAWAAVTHLFRLLEHGALGGREEVSVVVVRGRHALHAEVRIRHGPLLAPCCKKAQRQTVSPGESSTT